MDMTRHSYESHAMQPPQAVVSVLHAMVGQSRAAIDPSVQQIFRSAAFLVFALQPRLQGRKKDSRMVPCTPNRASVADSASAHQCLLPAAITSKGLG